MGLQENIIQWYRANKRDLPWRKTKDPYKIWVSEIILQQTRVAQGLSYYNRFTHRFPDIQSLAIANSDEVMLYWQGLGYYSRARNMHHAAKHIVNQLNGAFPKTYHELLKLKGIGEYTAAAISSFAFNENKAVIDGNVNRVYARLYNVKHDCKSSKGKNAINKIATELIISQDAAEFNQAIMEFGALQCTPQNPVCISCPVQLHCEALRLNVIDKRPVKSKPVKIRKRYLHFLILEYQNTYYIEKRNHKDIWQGLYQYPVIESNKELDINQLHQIDEWSKLNISKASLSNKSKLYKHPLSHQQLMGRFYHYILDKIPEKSEWIAVNKEQLKEYAFPRLIELYNTEYMGAN